VLLGGALSSFGFVLPGLGGIGGSGSGGFFGGGGGGGGHGWGSSQPSGSSSSPLFDIAAEDEKDKKKSKKSKKEAEQQAAEEEEDPLEEELLLEEEAPIRPGASDAWRKLVTSEGEYEDMAAEGGPEGQRVGTGRCVEVVIEGWPELGALPKKVGRGFACQQQQQQQLGEGTNRYQEAQRAWRFVAMAVSMAALAAVCRLSGGLPEAVCS
jgi:hypothetical protein